MIRPAVIPVTTPVVASIVATAVLLLLHVPPGVPWVSVMVYVTHTPVGPLIVGGALTVTTAVVKHVAETRYVITDVPAATPVTTPVALPIVATVVRLLLHVPPPLPVRVLVPPTPIASVPPIDDGGAAIVTFTVCTQPVGIE